MNGRLLESDPISKRRRTFHANHDATDIVVYTESDVTDIVEENKARYATVDERARYGGDGWGPLMAKIPLDILMLWQREWAENGLAPHEIEVDLARKLDDRDNLFMRTRPGRIGDMVRSGR